MNGIRGSTLFDDITSSLITASGESWMLGALFLLIIADAFVPLVPSETAVVALGSLAATAGVGGPNLWLIVPVAAVAALAGDLLLFAVGRSIRLDRFALFRKARVVRALEWARRGLDRRAAALIMTARYVPFGRIAVAVTAGTTRFPFRRYGQISVIACCSWAIYNVAVGAFFGAWLRDNPLVAVVVSVAVAVSLGIVIDAITRRLTGLGETPGSGAPE
ncbi:hypothetical protein GCM10027416_09960 [Okibacterium endophyticum]